MPCAGIDGVRQRQLLRALEPHQDPAAGAIGGDTTCSPVKELQFPWNFFESAQKVTKDVRFTGDVAAAGASPFARTRG